jgi:divalent metal cation (Fe/Co/Zn/Cd) transporter
LFLINKAKYIYIYIYIVGKFETVGSVTVASLLLAGAVGIGFHSFDLLLQTLHTTPTLIAAATDTAANTVASSAIETPSFLNHSHSHNNGVLDPNAAWFALASVLIKEWLYRASKLVWSKCFRCWFLMNWSFFLYNKSHQGGKRRT